MKSRQLVEPVTVPSGSSRSEPDSMPTIVEYDIGSISEFSPQVVPTSSASGVGGTHSYTQVVASAVSVRVVPSMT